MAVRNALPFEFITRWMDVAREFNLDLRTTAVMEERDRELEDFLGSFSAATYSGKARQTGSVSVPHATYTLIPFNSEVHDNADMVNLSTDSDRITITRSGYYMLTAEITFQTNTTGNRQVLISKNGGPFPAGTLLTAPAVKSLNTQTHVLTATQAELAVGDYLTLGAYHDAGVTLGVGGSHGDTNLTVTLLGNFS